MVNLINRDPPGRLSCLHALLKSIQTKFGSNTFTGEAAKHQVGEKNNPINFCTCAQEYNKETALIVPEKKYCPFLQSASSQSFCYLVNSNKLDTQKSKSVGIAILSLEALGLVIRNLNGLNRLENARLTSAGNSIAQKSFFDAEVQNYYGEAVVNYGPIVGFLHILNLKKRDVMQHSEVSQGLGRPNNNDRVKLSSGDNVKLNDGDAADARTRTSGTLQAWLTYSGYVSPNSTFASDFSVVDKFYSNPGNKLGYSRLFINRDKIEQFFENKPLVKHPLSYNFYIKGGGTAREYSQRTADGTQLENLALKEFSGKVRDRRYLLMLAYAKAASIEKGIDLRALAKLSNYKNSPFVVDVETHERIIEGTELDFLTIAGAPFQKDGFVIHPIVKLDSQTISKESPATAAIIDSILANGAIFA
jgi:hypothetical protein